MDGLVQDCSNSNVLAMESLQSCAKPSIYNSTIAEVALRTSTKRQPLPYLRQAQVWVLFGLLHSLGMVAVGQSVAYEAWPPIAYHHPVVTAWSKYGLGLPRQQWIVGSRDWWEFPPFCRCHWQSPCTALMAGICLPLGLCKETVKESSLSSLLYCMYSLVSLLHCPMWHGRHVGTCKTIEINKSDSELETSHIFP